jgi:hypothetical protein
MPKTSEDNNFDPATQARTAEILAFERVKALPPGPRPYDPQEYADFMRVDEMVERRKAKQPAPGTLGAERVWPEPNDAESFDALLARVRDEALEAGVDLLTYLKSQNYPQLLMWRLMKAEIGDLRDASIKVARVRKAKAKGDGEAARSTGAKPSDRGAPPIGESSDAEVVLISGADIEPEPVDWLWPNGLQRRVFNLLAGLSGGGKSTIALSWCATVTSGGPWPDGQSAGEPGLAIYWSGEDGIRDTLLPRFIAAGGERSNIRFIEGVRDGGRKRPFNPAVDMPGLEKAVKRLRDVRLIVLDPVAVVVKGDSHKNVETRVGLQPFADLCAQTGAAGLGVHHLTKNSAGGNPLDRISGSLAFHALPRCVWAAAWDQNGGKHPGRALVRVKMSNENPWGGFDYRFDQRALDDWPAIPAQRVLWGDVIDGSARDILGKFEAKPAAQTTRATVFLLETLKNGPQMAAELYAAAAKAGISERTLRFAYKKLGGTWERVGFQGTIIWELPKATTQ